MRAMAQKKRSRGIPPYALVHKFPDGWYYRVGSGKSYPWLGPFETEHVATQVRERATGGAWGLSRGAAHATKRSPARTRAVENALGYTPEAGMVEKAEAAYSDYSTRELRREIQSLEDAFEMAGGRGVDLADRLDAARTALALRGT